MKEETKPIGPQESSGKDLARNDTSEDLKAATKSNGLGSKLKWPLGVLTAVIVVIGLWRFTRRFDNPSVTFLKLLSPVLVAIATLWGLVFETYRKSENNTVVRRLLGPGYLAIVFIILMLGVSFTTPYLEARIKSVEAANQKLEADKQKLLHQAELEKQEAQHQESIRTAQIEAERTRTHAVEVGQQLEKAQKRESELTRLVQQAQANRILLENAKSELEILKGVWSEANRIEAANIKVEITYVISGELRRKPPLVLDRNSKLQLRILSAEEAAKANDIPWTKWHYGPLLNPFELELFAQLQQTVQRRSFNRRGFEYRQTTYYTDFAPPPGATNNANQPSQAIGDFANPLKWNGSVVEVYLSGEDFYLDANFKEAVLSSNVEAQLTPAERLSIPAQGSESDRSRLPCVAELVLYVRDRPVATAKAYVYDLNNKIVAKFNLMQMSTTTFTGFKLGK